MVQGFKEKHVVPLRSREGAVCQTKAVKAFLGYECLVRGSTGKMAERERQ
jgi:hypothetical protein